MSEEIICRNCGETKPKELFEFEKRTGRYTTRCLECYKKYYRDYYAKHKELNALNYKHIDKNATKICNKCGIEKPLTEFSFNVVSNDVINTCKACKTLASKKNYEANKEDRSEKGKLYREKNKEKLAEYQKAYREAHLEEKRAYSRKYHHDHREEILLKQKAYREAHIEEKREKDRIYAQTHKEQAAKRSKEWAKNNAEHLFQYQRKYREKHAEEIYLKRSARDKVNRPRINAYYSNKRQSDPLFKLSTQIRNLINKSLKNKGYGKDTHTYEIVGCDYEELWEHLKKTWKNNYGTEWNGEDYHIDHIIPLATARTKQDVIKLCHYNNLQLLKPNDNLKKSKRLDWELN